MRKIILTTLGIVAVLAFSLYATIGETGPIGWINAAQARGDGTYSRGLSAVVLMIALCLVVMGGLYVLEFVQKIRRAVGGPAAPTPAPRATPLDVPMPAMSGWRLGLTVWAAFMVLLWGGLLAWFGWDWHLRRVDAVSTYVPLQLGRGTDPARPEDGSHLALQGAMPLWDRALSRRSNRQGSLPDAIYVPIAAAGWRPGEPVHLVARFGELQQLVDLQRAAGDETGPLLVRVDGTVDSATRPVFEQHGVPVAEDAAMVTAVVSRSGQPTQADPPFDWLHVNLIGGIVTFLFTVLPLAAALGVRRQAWIQRRRAARNAA